MKSLFNRLRANNQRDAQSSSRPSSSQSLATDAKPPFLSRRSSSHSTHSSTARRTSTPIAALHSHSSSSSDSTRPHSVVGPLDDLYPAVIDGSDDHGDGTIRVRTVSAGAGEGNNVKKVTFRSPAPTPTTSLALDDFSTAPNTAIHPVNNRPKPSSQPHGKNTPASPQKSSFNLPRSSTQSRSSSRQSLPNVSKINTARKSSLPSSNATATTATDSAMSPTPSEQSFGGLSGRSYLPEANSWSEMAEDDLIANLGPRERTRQEVLWEIVSSEERYVHELVKLNETFCKALLPPSATSPTLNLYSAKNDLGRTLSPALSIQSPSPPLESSDYLPIAAQYSSSAKAAPPTATGARMEAYNTLTNGRPSKAPSHKISLASVNVPSGPRAHQSLPPPKRDVKPSGGFGRMSYHPGAKSKAQTSRATSGGSISSMKSRDIPLPEPLEKVLTVLANGILEGHIKLAAALRKRYDNQYPLVRSLADVFTAHSYILREYATYVLHLEKALGEVDNALSAYTSASSSKRASKRLEETELGQLGKTLLMLEELAAERGEAGLTISLSKPFQRLLKYPLLFQNLLFNTDPSLKEYEATLAMVDEVEEIVRAIEDQKASWEEREMTRDVWARIDGLDRDKLLMAPKPNRLLVGEENVRPAEGELKPIREVSVRQKKSLRRLSDILKGSTESADLWIVKFSDVSLLCERTGMTNLPLSSKFKGSRSDSMPEMSGRARAANMGKRHGSIKARNLYRFVKVHEWHLKPKTGSTEGLLSMEEISRVRSHAPSEPPASGLPKPAPQASLSRTSTPPPPEKPIHVPLKGDGGPSPAKSTPRRRDGDTDTVVSDRMSVMSFAFRGSDQLKPVPKRTKPAMAPGTNGSAGTNRRPLSASDPTAVFPQRRSTSGHVIGQAASAKFAHRLRSAETEGAHGDSTIRRTSRNRRSLPPAMAASASTRTGRSSPALSPTDRNGTRPPWNASTGPAKASGPSIAPSTAPSTRGSVRGISGATTRMETSVTGSGKRYVPKPAGEVKKQGQGQSLKPSPSADSGVAGMWTAYREGGAVGTPRKPAVPPNRQLGGRI